MNLKCSKKIWINLPVLASACFCVSVSVCECVCLCANVGMCVRLCAFVSMCACVCVHLRVCVSERCEKAAKTGKSPQSSMNASFCCRVPRPRIEITTVNYLKRIAYVGFD